MKKSGSIGIYGQSSTYYQNSDKVIDDFSSYGGSKGVLKQRMGSEGM